MNEQDCKNIMFEISVTEDEKINYIPPEIIAELQKARNEIEVLNETIESIQNLKPECDKLDYALAASSGALCGILDIFGVGEPENSPIGNFTDEWFDKCTMSFARKCGWIDNGEKRSAIRYLEKKFNVPYDHRGAGDAGSGVYNLTPKNHHFKSLAHNPSLLGLIFSILDQFANTSHFVSNGELKSLEKADRTFELKGNNTPSKLFAAFANWFGHLISDMTGSSGSKGRGMGIPSPLLTIANDIIAIKSKLRIPITEFNEALNKLALDIYNNGYDSRFQTAQAIPVCINEMFVRLMYSTRRLVKYFAETDKENRSAKLMWDRCEPFKNSTVKRMLTVAHGTFCILDIGDAAIRGIITKNPTKFFLRLNIVGVGRFAISLYGEVNRGGEIQRGIEFATKEKTIVFYYIEGLEFLADRYNSKAFEDLVKHLKSGDYTNGLEASKRLAIQRNVPEYKICENKEDIDTQFSRRKKYE